MQTKLAQFQQRVANLENLAEEVASLAEKQSRLEDVQPELSVKGQRWYRGARELLVQHNFSGLPEFENCYQYYVEIMGGKRHRASSDIEEYIGRNTSMGNLFPSREEADDHYQMFKERFEKARALLLSALEELESRELPIRSQLSFAISADEFERAEELFKAASGDEAILRAAGVVARVALERHLFTVADSRQIPIEVNPPHKRKPEAEDVITTLLKASIITPIQQSELQSLFKVGNNCAHPKETIKPEDVGRLIKRGKEVAAIIL